MSRFENYDTPAYRTVLPKSSWRPQAVMLITTICLILLAVQSINLAIVVNPFDGLENRTPENKQVEFDENQLWIDDVILGESFVEYGQWYRYVIVEINNSNEFYSENLNLLVQSNFAGKKYDQINLTLNEPDSDIKLIQLKIHELDDTTIQANLKYYEDSGEILIDQKIRPSLNDIYITEAYGKISQKSPFLTKSVEITVVVYNEGAARAPDTISVLISNPSLFGSIYRASIKNNNTIDHNDFWQVSFKLDVLDDETTFNVKLYMDEKTEDEAEVFTN